MLVMNILFYPDVFFIACIKIACARFLFLINLFSIRHAPVGLNEKNCTVTYFVCSVSKRTFLP